MEDEEMKEKIKRFLEGNKEANNLQKQLEVSMVEGEKKAIENNDTRLLFMIKLQKLTIKVTNDCGNLVKMVLRSLENDETDFSACINVLEQLEKMYDDLESGE